MNKKDFKLTEEEGFVYLEYKGPNCFLIILRITPNGLIQMASSCIETNEVPLALNKNGAVKILKETF